VFSVRYGLDLYVLFERNSAFKVLNGNFTACCRSAIFWGHVIPSVCNWFLYMYHPLQHTKPLHSAHTMYLYVPYGSRSKQRLFPQTALTGWAL
jgi:hypothetical protein